MTAEVPGTSALPATQIRMSVGASLPSGMVDIVAGTSGGHATLVAVLLVASVNLLQQVAVPS